MFPIRDHNPSSQIPFITFLIILLCGFAFYLQITGSDPEGFVYTYGLVPRNVDWTNWSSLFPFITSMFLHGGWIHIISNLWFLWIFGDNIEATLGHIRFFLFYLLCGIVAGLLQYGFNIDSEIPMIGASGAIAGVLGAYLALFPKHKIDTLIISFGGLLTKAQLPASVMLVYWFIIQIFSGVGSIGWEGGGVAWWAHVGGFVAGWGIVKIIGLFPHRQ